MNLEKWLLAVLSVSWSGWLLSFAIGKWTHRQETITENPVYRIAQLETHMKAVDDIPLLVHRIRELETRMNQAGNKMSDLTDAVQGLPERLRGTFVTRMEWDMSERRIAERRQGNVEPK